MIARRTLLGLCGLASTAIGLSTLVLFEGDGRGSSSRETAITCSSTNADLAASPARREDERDRSGGIPPSLRQKVAIRRHSLRISLLEKETRRPLPLATVHAWEDEDHTRSAWLCERIGPDMAAYIAEHGVASTPDDDGIVELDIADKPVLVAARFEGLFALMCFDGDDDEVQEMELAPSHDVDVRVRDSSGVLRAGVKVGLGECRDDDTFWSDVTDASGQCRIHDFETVAGCGPSASHEAIAIRLAIPSTPAIEQWIDPQRMPNSPIELVLPPTGGLRMRVVDARGRVVEVDGRVRVGVSEISSPGSIQPVITDTVTKVALVDGRAFAPSVTLGQLLWVAADIGGTDDPNVEVQGPRSEGEIVDVDITLDEGASFVRARAVDENGASLARLPLTWSCLVDDGDEIIDMKSSALTTDDEGRFTWTLPRAIHTESRLARRTCHLCQSSTALLRRQAILVLPRELESDVVDLGDVTFAQSGPLVQGRAVDESGRDVRGVSVEAVVLTSSSADRRAAGNFDPALDRVSSRTPCGDVRTGEDGTFAIFGPCLDLRWALRIGNDYGKVPRIVPFACGSGQTRMQFVSPSMCTLSGSALVDREWNGAALGVRFIASGESEPHWAAWWRAGDRVRFRLEDVAPAHGRLEFTLDEAATPKLLEIQGIELVAGQDAHPQSLVDVDLRGKLPTNAARGETEANSLDLEIVDERGAPVASGMAWIWKGESEAVAVPWVAGRVHVEKEVVRRVEVWSPGFRFHVSVQPIASQRIVLRPEIGIDITFVLPPELKGPDVVMTGSISFMTDIGDAQASRVLNGESSFALDVTGKAHVRVSASGSYAADLTFARRGFAVTENDDGARSVGAERPFVVRDVDGHQGFTVELDAAEMRVALDELGFSKR